MTDLQFWTALSALWIASAWAPYIIDRTLVRGLMGAFEGYNPDAKPQSPWAQRAMRAHTVSIEAFAGFAPLAVIAMIMMPEDSYPGTLAMSFFLGIFAHYWIYCADIIVLRTLAFVLAWGSSLALGLRLLGVI